MVEENQLLELLFIHMTTSDSIEKSFTVKLYILFTSYIKVTIFSILHQIKTFINFDLIGTLKSKNFEYHNKKYKMEIIKNKIKE